MSYHIPYDVRVELRVVEAELDRLELSELEASSCLSCDAWGCYS